jgi:hypothetical protein
MPNDLYLAPESSKIALRGEILAPSGESCMRTLFWIAVVIGMAAWVVILQRRLLAARMRGDMYRDIAARLDRRVVELSEGEHS